MRINKSLWKGSFILLVSFGLYSFLNFVFQLSMARMLSVADYGVLAVLFSIFYMLGVFTETIQLIVTKYSADEDDTGKLKDILKKSLKKSFKISLWMFLLYLLAAIPMVYLLDINYTLLAISGVIIFTSIILPIPRGIMQGRRKFKALGFNMILESAVKLLLAFVFVYFGFKVYGAITGAILGVGISLVFSFIPLRKIILQTEKKAETEGIHKYAKSAFLATLVVVVFYSIDILIAKILFSDDIAGAYSIASILSKIIFWGTLPISKAMFPLSAQNNSGKSKSESVLANSFIILLIGIFVSLAMFYFLPDFIIKIFSGKTLPEASRILFYLGIANGFVSLTNLLLLHNLSTGKTHKYYWLILFLIAEIFLLLYFSKNLVQFSIAYITASVIFFGGVVYLLRKEI